MKNILAAFTFSLFFISCSDNTDVIPEEDPIAVTSLSGTVQCAGNSPLANFSLAITDSNGTVYSTTTDASGNYNFDNILEDDYTMSFTDPSFYNYSQQEYDAIAQEMQEVVFGIRTNSNLEHLAYNIVNYEDGLTTLDMVLMDKLKTGDLLMSEVDIPWRYVKSSELTTNSSISNEIQFSYTEDLVLDVTAIFVGDVSGLACQ